MTIARRSLAFALLLVLCAAPAAAQQDSASTKLLHGPAPIPDHAPVAPSGLKAPAPITPAPNPLLAPGARPPVTPQSPALDAACAELLRLTPDECMAAGRARGPWGAIDAADTWASCKRAETLARFERSALLHARMERLDRRLVELTDALAELAGAPADAGFPREAAARWERRHATLEQLFADVAMHWLDGTAHGVAAETARECDALAARLESRLGASPVGGGSPLSGQRPPRLGPESFSADPAQRFREGLDDLQRIENRDQPAPERDAGLLAALKLLERMEDELLPPAGTLPRTPRPMPRQIEPGTPHH